MDERNEAGDYYLPSHTRPSPTLLDQEEDGDGEINELDLNHIFLEIKTKFLLTDITHTSPYNAALLATTTHTSGVLYDGCD